MKPPTTAPTMPRTTIMIRPSPPPMMRLAMKPAIAPSTIQAMIPIGSSSFRVGAWRPPPGDAPANSLLEVGTQGSALS